MYKFYPENGVRPPRRAFKFLLIMKLTTLLLITAILQVSANTFAQKVTLSEKNATLTNVFDHIRTQTGYDFFFTSSILKDAKLVNINVKDEELALVLKKIFTDQPFDFSIGKKSVVISKKEPSLLQPIKDALALPIDIRGKVTDEKGRPLIGATVSVIGAKQSTASDEQGNFILRSLNPDNELAISYVGYTSQIVKVGKNTVFNIVLHMTANALDNVVIQGYGTTSKRLTTGDIAVITAADIEKQPVTNVLQAMQNLVPGLSVVQTNGFASAPYKVTIRGSNNLPSVAGTANASDPLYIVDGVPIIGGSGDLKNQGINQSENSQGAAGGQSPLFGINPADVESISVLKDADATAIYGARGANGVILITTKKGIPGKTIFNVNVYQGASLQMKKLDLMNTQQYVSMRKQALVNDHKSLNSSQYDLAVWDTTRYTDWQKKLLSTATTTDAQMSLSGGSETTTFRANGSYHNETPPFPGDFKERRISAVLGVTHRTLNNKLNINLQMNYSNTFSDLPAADPTSSILVAPDAPDMVTANGLPNWLGWKPGTYPFAGLYQPSNSTTNNLITNMFLNYTIVKGLVLSTNIGYTFYNQSQFNLNPGAAQDPTYTQRGQSYFNTNKGSTWLIEPNLSYIVHKGVQSLTVMAGGTMQSSDVSGSYINGNGYTTDGLLGDIAAASTVVGSNNYAQTRFQSLYTRATYNYDNKYILNLNARRDGSSRFGPDKQYGDFGSVGAAWIFSDEKIVKEQLPWLSFGKLRSSYGITGGDGLGDYQYLASFNTPYYKYDNKSVLQLSRGANPDFSWADTKKLEIATDLGFFKNNLMLTVAWYRNRTENQLVTEPQPGITGFQTVVVNMPSVVQNAGWEFTLTSKNIATKNLNWSTGFNLSWDRNKLLSFKDLENSDYRYYYTIGQSISRVGLYHSLGLNPQTGKFDIQDVNKDGSYDLENDGYYYNTIPDFTGAITNNVYYKGLALNFTFAFVKQKGVETIPTGAGNINANQLVDNTPRWAKPGDVATLPMYSTTSLSYNYVNSDATWKDASYIRLQNVSLSYNFPANWANKVKFSTMRIYAQGQNIFTITHYKGSDPAAPNIGLSLPPREILTLGLQFTM